MSLRSSCLHSESQVCQGNIGKPCLKTKQKHPQILGPTSLRSQHRLKTRSSPRILEASRARRGLLRRAALRTEQQLDSWVLPSETTSYTYRENIYKQSCVPLENPD